MKRAIGRLDRITRDFDGNGMVTFTIPNFRQVCELKELDPKKEYSIEIREIKSQRSLQQNRYFWKLVTEIDRKVNGHPSKAGMDDVYLDLLDRANAKIDFLAALPETEKVLLESFRIVRFVNALESGMNLYKVVVGSSKMDTKEMSELIDAALDYAAQVGIETDYWEEMLR